MNNTSVVTLAFAVASAVLVTTSQKAEAFSISGDWEYASTNGHGGNQIFYKVKNKSSQKAFDFHIEYSDEALRSRGDRPPQENYFFTNGIEIGGIVEQISIQTTSAPSADGKFDAYWTDKNHARIVSPVPEPLTIFGSATALGFIPLFKKAYLRRQKKS